MKSRIREVWRSNFAQEMAVIRELIEDFPNVSMVGPFSSFTDSYHLKQLP